jgi:hypothetical protein
MQSVQVIVGIAIAQIRVISMPEKITSQQIREIGGQPCLVLIGETGAASFYFPANGVQSIFDNARSNLHLPLLVSGSILRLIAPPRGIRTI